MSFRYVYLGDRLTRPDLIGRLCNPVCNAAGNCVVSTRSASALVEFDGGTRCVVMRRRLRLTPEARAQALQ